MDLDPDPYLARPRSPCFCCDGDSIDRDQTDKAKEKFFKKCFRICLLTCILVGYTFVGAVIFIATEDVTMTQITSALVADKLVPPVSNESAYRWFSRLGEESRNKAVHNIWNITVNLNILYKQNWTTLAAEELNHFQERLLEKLWQEKLYLESMVYHEDAQRSEPPPTHWKLGKAFLYSMSIISTIGLGNTLAKSSNGKLTTMLYASIGLPVMFMYLSSVGSLLSICARHVFSRTLCCCLCSKCGYCCYDEKLMEEKERRMRRKRQQQEQLSMQQPFYVKTPSMNSLEADDKKDTVSIDSTKIHNEYSRFLAPLVVCVLFTFLYVLAGSVMLIRFDNWNLVDSIFFSFMLISTIGIGDVPTGSALSPNAQYIGSNDTLLVWFFSFYIFVGLAFSSMCFCTIHDGVKRKMNKLYVYSDKLRKRTTDEVAKEMASRGTTDVHKAKANGDVSRIADGEPYTVSSFIGENGYPQPEIVAITTGIPTANIKREMRQSSNQLNVLTEEDEENVEV